MSWDNIYNINRRLAAWETVLRFWSRFIVSWDWCRFSRGNTLFRPFLFFNYLFTNVIQSFWERGSPRGVMAKIAGMRPQSKRARTPVVLLRFFFFFFFFFFRTKYSWVWTPLSGPVRWGCRIHRLHLCRGVRLLQQMSWIWHKTIWWWGSSNAGALGNAEYPFIVIAFMSTLAWSGSTW